MSYDINFWKPKRGAAPDPGKTYSRLGRPGAALGKLEGLPVEQILAKLKEAFPDFDPAAEFPNIEVPEGNIEFAWGEKYFRFDFRGPETGAEKAKVWEIMSGFGCVCYDPQTDTLHTPDNPPGYRPLTPEEVKQVEKIFGGRDINSMMKHLERKRRRLILGCLLLVLLASVVLGAVVTGVVYLLR